MRKISRFELEYTLLRMFQDTKVFYDPLLLSVFIKGKSYTGNYSRYYINTLAEFSEILTETKIRREMKQQ